MVTFCDQRWSLQATKASQLQYTDDLLNINN